MFSHYHPNGVLVGEQTSKIGKTARKKKKYNVKDVD